MKPVDVKPNTYIYSSKGIKNKDLKLKNTVPWTYVINDLDVEEIVGTFYKK